MTSAPVVHTIRGWPKRPGYYDVTEATTGLRLRVRSLRRRSTKPRARRVEGPDWPTLGEWLEAQSPAFQVQWDRAHEAGGVVVRGAFGPPLFNIDASTYELWRGTTASTGGTLTLAMIEEAFRRAARYDQWSPWLDGPNPDDLEDAVRAIEEELVRLAAPDDP